MSVKIDNLSQVLVSSSKTSGRIDDVIDHTKLGNPYPAAKISCDIFKSASVYTSSGAPFTAFIRGHVEPNAGGHYYVHGFDGTTYQSASCRVPLSQCSVGNLNGRRRACVSLGMSSKGSTYTMCDVGLANDGDGWYPFCWCRGYFNSDGSVKAGNQFFRAGDIPIRVSPTDTGTILTGSGNVTIKVEVGTTSTLDYVRAEYTYNGKTGAIALDVPKGQMHALVNGIPNVHFYRFMSLIPRYGDGTMDDADNSALSAVMDTLKLGTSTWNASQVQFAWVVQDENTTDIRISNIRSSTIGADADYARIYHTYQAH